MPRTLHRRAGDRMAGKKGTVKARLAATRHGFHIWASKKMRRMFTFTETQRDKACHYVDSVGRHSGREVSPAGSPRGGELLASLLRLARADSRMSGSPCGLDCDAAVRGTYAGCSRLGERHVHSARLPNLQASHNLRFRSRLQPWRSTTADNAEPPAKHAKQGTSK
jgi:hypothetical protein